MDLVYTAQSQSNTDLHIAQSWGMLPDSWAFSVTQNTIQFVGTPPDHVVFSWWSSPTDCQIIFLEGVNFDLIYMLTITEEQTKTTKSSF